MRCQKPKMFLIKKPENNLSTELQELTKTMQLTINQLNTAQSTNNNTNNKNNNNYNKNKQQNWNKKMVLVETTLGTGKKISKTEETTITISRIGDHQTLNGKIKNPTRINNEIILLNQVKNTAIITTSLVIYPLNAGFVHNNIILQLYLTHNTLHRTSQTRNP